MPAKVVLSLTYNEVARRLIMHQTPEEIAQAMALQVGTLKAMMRRPDFIETLEKVRGKAYEGVDKTIESDARNIRQDIIDAAAPSFDRLKMLLDHAASEGVQMHVAQDFLDRAGHGKAPEKEPQIQITINPIEADVIATALEKEKAGRQRLEKLEIRLAKPPSEIEHPALQLEEKNANEPSSEPTD